ncbi:RNA polymerase sigma-70 factor (ECF subfamily) [Dinghuibacter silviterrae]|uniref:RNA polymerase sigma-70 factor (ECF subfamily) n=1 Tax=Dinghuibacter silviterrae TaxID=1539049 RepID=A0A4R8DR80_9BACT|nr:RNA polymerase sigma-70 factor (ECF subfamily) [Dinghuibacter silviterrae]
MTAPSPYEEDRLLISIAAGDVQAFSAVYYHYQDDLYRFVLRLVKIPALAEDVLQDIFLKIWEARQQLPGVHHFPGYLYTVARNHTLNVLQSVARSTHALNDLVRYFREQRVDDEALSKDYRRFIDHALHAIPARSREIFHKCREQGMTYEEVGREMGISRNAVKKHMMTAIRTLKDAAERDLGVTLEAAVVLATVASFSIL